jgi:hypothetical protein
MFNSTPISKLSRSIFKFLFFFSCFLAFTFSNVELLFLDYLKSKLESRSKYLFDYAIKKLKAFNGILFYNEK